MPEGDVELPDDGLPDEQPDDDDDPCPGPADIWKSRSESLSDET